MSRQEGIKEYEVVKTKSIVNYLTLHKAIFKWTIEIIDEFYRSIFERAFNLKSSI